MLKEFDDFQGAVEFATRFNHAGIVGSVIDADGAYLIETVIPRSQWDKKNTIRVTFHGQRVTVKFKFFNRYTVFYL